MSTPLATSTPARGAAVRLGRDDVVVKLFLHGMTKEDIAGALNISKTIVFKAIERKLKGVGYFLNSQLESGKALSRSKGRKRKESSKEDETGSGKKMRDDDSDDGLKDKNTSQALPKGQQTAAKGSIKTGMQEEAKGGKKESNAEEKVKKDAKKSPSKSLNSSSASQAGKANTTVNKSRSKSSTPRGKSKKTVNYYSQAATHARHNQLGPIDPEFLKVGTSSGLSLTNKSKRLEFCNDLVKYIESNGDRAIVFSATLLLTVEGIEAKNDASSKAGKPTKVLALLLISSDGQKCPVCFFPDDEEKPRAAALIQLLQQDVVPWIQQAFPNGNYILQLDNNPAFYGKDMVNALKDNNVTAFPKGIWPSRAAELSPLCYGVMPYVKQFVARAPKKKLSALKKAANEAWGHITSEFIKGVCSEFRQRLDEIIKQEGGYISVAASRNVE